MNQIQLIKSMNSFSEFHFQGNVSSMKLRVTIRRGSRLAGLPSFTEFANDLHRQETTQDSQTNRTVDEIQFTWGQHIDAKPNTGLIPPRAGEQGRNRTDPRIFTLVSGEQWPPHLEPYRNSNLDLENEIKPIEAKTLPRPSIRRISPLQIWHRENPIIDLPPKSSKRSVKQKQAVMLIVANCASIHGSEKSPLDEVVICRISCENRTLFFSPPLTKSGYKLENRHGSLTAFISILDEEFTTIVDDGIINDSDYISEDSFDLPRGQRIFYSYYVELVEALNFPHDPLFVEYRVEFPSYFIAVTDQSQMIQNQETETISGRTRTFYAKKSGKDQVTVLNHLFEIAFAIDPTTASKMKNEKISWPTLVFRVCSQDFWGRCFISGYGSVQLPMLGFKQEFEANCWRMKAPESQRFAPLRDLLIGDVHELKDYLENKALNGSSRAGLSTTSSGTLRLRCSRLIQSRNFVSTEMMNRLKYGSMMDKIGINSSLHWRIMKVLMEFEEARRELLRIRARNKPQ